MKTVRTLLPLIPGLVVATIVVSLALLAERLEIAIAGRAWLEPLVLAILIGTAVRTCWTPAPRFDRGIACAAKTMLELAVVAMGATVSFAAIAAVGFPLLVAIATTVIVAIGTGLVIGRAAGLPAKMALLIACGNAICGNSAIAAIAPVIDADSDDVATAIAFTAVLGIAVVVALPPLAHGLHLSPAGGGILAGLTVYAVPQVLAAAGPLGAAAVQSGTLVKLIRVLMLGPIVAGLSLATTRRSAGAKTPGSGLPLLHLMPPFIVAFLGLAGINSLGLLPHGIDTGAHVASELLTVLAMAGLGLSVDLRSIFVAGPRVVFVVTACLIVLATTAIVALDAIAVV